MNSTKIEILKDQPGILGMKNSVTPKKFLKTSVENLIVRLDQVEDRISGFVDRIIRTLR
jgi:hypothetical protein